MDSENTIVDTFVIDKQVFCDAFSEGYPCENREDSKNFLSYLFKWKVKGKDLGWIPQEIFDMLIEQFGAKPNGLVALSYLKKVVSVDSTTSDQGLNLKTSDAVLKLASRLSESMKPRRKIYLVTDNPKNITKFKSDSNIFMTTSSKDALKIISDPNLLTG